MQQSPQNLPSVQALVRKFNGDLSHLRLLHQGVGMVFETIREGGPVIIKVNVSSTSTASILQARLCWIRYLQENGLFVPELIPSSDEKLVEEVEADSMFYAAYVYHKIPLSEENKINWNEPDMPMKLGRTMGQMHHLAKVYCPPVDLSPIEQWYDADWIQSPEQVIHPSQEPVISAILNLRQQIALFPKTPQSYGLIHDDLHTGNVFNLSGRLFILDFDLVHYSWFAADIASALLFRVWIGPEKDNPELQQAATHFLHDLLMGYCTQETPPPGWQEMLPVFLKIREVSLFQSDFRSLSVEQGRQDPFFAYVFDNIAHNHPFLKGLDQVIHRDKM